MSSIWQPELLCVKDRCHVKWGANQAWYGDAWQRKAGCGPTTCANLIWYLAQSQETLKGLWPRKGAHEADMLRLMEELWLTVTPTCMGVDSTSAFSDGAVRFAKNKGIRLMPHILDIPYKQESRPSEDALMEYLHNAFSDDLPVAFLNLDNGALQRLESWHWVTLISVGENNLIVIMLDQGRKVEIDLGLWLRTTGMGGGFVVLEAA